MSLAGHDGSKLCPECEHSKTFANKAGTICFADPPPEIRYVADCEGFTPLTH